VDSLFRLLTLEGLGSRQARDNSSGQAVKRSRLGRIVQLGTLLGLWLRNRRLGDFIGAAEQFAKETML
jgi:hypothetical protein